MSLTDRKEGRRKMGKEKKGLSMADKFRKEERKKEIARSKKKQAQEKAHRDLMSNPEKIEVELQKLQKESDENKLDKGLKEKIKEMKLMLQVSQKKAIQEGRLNPPGADQGSNPPKIASVPSSSSSSKAAATDCLMQPNVNPFYHPVFNQLVQLLKTMPWLE